MVIKKRARVLFIFMFLLPTFVFAKKQKEEVHVIRNESDIYYFEGEEKGKPVFTQILKWTSSPAVYYYLITLKTEKGNIVFSRKKTETASLEVNLKPGKYVYKVYVFNLLDVLDQESDWLPIEIKRAKFPVVKSISPSHMYLEDEDFNFTINGQSFSPDMDIFFEAEKGGGVRRVTPDLIDGNKIVFNFKKPEQFLDSPYIIHIVDPSGLQGASDTFTVKYRKPIDFYVGVAYTPYIPVYDKWYTGLWNKKFYPFGITGELGLIFAKRRFGFFGFEVRGFYRQTTATEEKIVLKNNTISGSFNLLYEIWFIRKMAFCLKAGGGVIYNTMQFQYPGGGSNEEKEKMLDGFYNVGLGFRVKPVKFVYFDIMVYMEQVLNKGVKPIGIIPEVVVGFRY